MLPAADNSDFGSLAHHEVEADEGEIDYAIRREGRCFQSLSRTCDTPPGQECHEAGAQITSLGHECRGA